MSKGTHDERRKRQAEEAKEAARRQAHRYTHPFRIPVKVPSGILRLAGVGKPGIKFTNKYAQITTREQLETLVEDLKTGKLATDSGPVFILETLMELLKAFGLEQPPEDSKERKVH